MMSILKDGEMQCQVENFNDAQMQTCRYAHGSTELDESKRLTLNENSSNIKCVETTEKKNLSDGFISDISSEPFLDSEPETAESSSVKRNELSFEGSFDNNGCSENVNMVPKFKKTSEDDRDFEMEICEKSDDQDLCESYLTSTKEVQCTEESIDLEMNGSEGVSPFEQEMDENDEPITGIGVDEEKEDKNNFKDHENLGEKCDENKVEENKKLINNGNTEDALDKNDDKIEDDASLHNKIEEAASEKVKSRDENSEIGQRSQFEMNKDSEQVEDMNGVFVHKEDETEKEKANELVNDVKKDDVTCDFNLLVDSENVSADEGTLKLSTDSSDNEEFTGNLNTELKDNKEHTSNSPSENNKNIAEEALKMTTEESSDDDEPIINLKQKLDTGSKEGANICKTVDELEHRDASANENNEMSSDDDEPIMRLKERLDAGSKGGARTCTNSDGIGSSTIGKSESLVETGAVSNNEGDHAPILEKELKSEIVSVEKGISKSDSAFPEKQNLLEDTDDDMPILENSSKMLSLAAVDGALELTSAMPNGSSKDVTCGDMQSCFVHLTRLTEAHCREAKIASIACSIQHPSFRQCYIRLKHLSHAFGAISHSKCFVRLDRLPSHMIPLLPEATFENGDESCDSFEMKMDSGGDKKRVLNQIYSSRAKRRRTKR